MERRDKTVNRTSLHGYVLSDGVPVSPSNYTDEQFILFDYIGKKVRKEPLSLKGLLPPSDCDILKTKSIPIHANRKEGTIGFQNFACQYGGRTGSHGLLGNRGSLGRARENERLTLILLERTNPFRPEFSVPVYIKELVEIGSMFSLAAKTFAGYVGGQYLNYKFGWEQFVRDVRTLSNITKTLERRVREFESLSKHGGLRRGNIHLDSRYMQNTLTNHLMNSTWGLTVRATSNLSASMKVTGSVRWIPTRDFAKDLRTLSHINLAFKKVFDLEAIDAETLWNMIPFTWLADYFINIGAYLKANAGMVQVTPKDICILRRIESSEYCYRSSEHPGMSVGNIAVFNYKLYARDVMPGLSFPTVRTEMLSASQWKIVLALFLRLKGG